ncbi:MAG: hypothetical protein ACYC8T_31255 [Myxococcaceae bacterium]
MANLLYDDRSDGSFMAWWWEDLAPEEGVFTLEAVGAPGSLALQFELADRTGIAPPQPTMTGDSLQWSPLEGAASSSCRFYQGSILVSSTAPSGGLSCNASSLGDGAYTAVVQATSADLPALAADRTQLPALPEAFHVAEGRIGFSRGPTGGCQIRAAGGKLNFGSAAGGLAIWVALGIPDGGAPAEEWTLSVVGPGLPSASSLNASYPAGSFQRLLWSYDAQPRAGTYTVTAQAGAQSVSTQVSLGDPPAFGIVSDIHASANGSGAADIDWTAEPGARSYWVNVWPSGAGSSAPAASIWTHSPSARFPPATFQSGKTYDVYVTATDADMTVTTSPAGSSAVSVSENTYAPVGFTAP